MQQTSNRIPHIDMLDMGYSGKHSALYKQSFQHLKGKLSNFEGKHVNWSEEDTVQVAKYHKYASKNMKPGSRNVRCETSDYEYEYPLPRV